MFDPEGDRITALAFHYNLEPAMRHHVDVAMWSQNSAEQSWSSAGPPNNGVHLSDRFRPAPGRWRCGGLTRRLAFGQGRARTARR